MSDEACGTMDDEMEYYFIKKEWTGSKPTQQGNRKKKWKNKLMVLKEGEIIKKILKQLPTLNCIFILPDEIFEI